MINENFRAASVVTGDRAATAIGTTKEILKILSRHEKVGEDVNLDGMAKRTFLGLISNVRPLFCRRWV